MSVFQRFFGAAAVGNNDNNDDDEDDYDEEEEEKNGAGIKHQKVADSIRGNKIVSSTKKGYSSKMKTMGKWLVEESALRAVRLEE